MTSKQKRANLLEQLAIQTDEYFAGIFMALVDDMVMTASNEMRAYHSKQLNELTNVMMRGEATREQVMLHAILNGAYSNVKDPSP